MCNVSDLPKLGCGVVWWPGLDPLCRPEEGLVQVIEAEPETFWTARSGKAGTFSSQLADAIGHLPQPKLLHGVGAPFGGAAAQTASHRQTLAGDIAAVRPAWISDHLSFDRFGPDLARGDAQPIFTGFFMPPAQSADGVVQAAVHIRRRRAACGVPVAFENAVSYLPPAPGEMPDGDFVAAVAEAADCGILLDLHNLLCNERNGRQSVRDFCAAIPLDRVWEIHLAGGAAERGFWLDAHAGIAEAALMEIAAEIVPLLPCLGAMIFEIVPECVAAAGLPLIAKMLGQMNDIWGTRRVVAGGAPQENARYMPNAITPEIWEYAIGCAVTGRRPPELPPEFAEWLSRAAAPLELYRFLAEEGRASSLVISAPNAIRLLLRSLGERQTRALLAGFWGRVAPAYTSAEEGDAFLDFLEATAIEVPGLQGAVAMDRGGLALRAA